MATNPMAAYATALAPYQDAMNAAAGAHPGLSANTIAVFLSIESGGNANTPDSNQGAQTLIQILPNTWKQYYGDTPEPTDPNLLISAMGNILGQFSDDYNGNLSLMAVAYVAGNGAANKAQNAIVDSGGKLSPEDAIQQTIAGYTPDNQKKVNDYIAKVSARSVNQASVAGQTGASSTGAATPPGTPPATGPSVSIADKDAIAALPVSGTLYSPAQAAALVLSIEPPTLVISAGLDQVPWFDNLNMVQVNGPTSDTPAPITFKVYFADPTQPLPATLELNASLNRFERSMKHISNHQQTRTGVLVTLWGMEPDVITGSGSTGMFANQFGITDFLSLSTLPAYIQQQVTNALDPTPVSPLAGILGPAVNRMASTDTMRIAAKDAFMELLALFRQNGMVWFQGTGDKNPPTTSSAQLAPNAWSSTFGLSLAQMNARRNDPAARGGVILSFRGSIYYGFFSSMSWTEDASKPFCWNFNFTFKVERTSKQIFQPHNTLAQTKTSPNVGSGLQQQSASATTGLTTNTPTLTELA